ncbi:tape measure protein [Nocardia sp. NPDC004260]
MAVELAVGYVSLVADASQIPGQINRALRGAGQDADRVGQGIGRRMASGIGNTLRLGVATAGAAAGATIAAALSKGFGRLTAIDDAQGKLRGLGHDAATIQKIMDSALASVKGTAFGLGDAATIAASAVAAGIKPGAQLTNYLKLIADSATIAGSSLGEMGSIINQTTTGGTVFTDTLNQLADRGIPIFTWLQDETKKTGKDFRKMVENGDLDAQTFQKVLAKHVAGAALESGKTVHGSLANIGAALSRLGAAALAPGFSRLPGFFAQFTTGIDQAAKRVQPFAEKLDAILFKQVGPKLSQMWKDLGRSDAAQFATGALGDAANVVSDLGHSAMEAGPALLGIGKALAAAGGAIGAGAWSAAIETLQAGAQIAGGVLVPALQTLSGVVSGNQTAVTALIAGWLAWKLIPPRLQAVGTQMTALQARTVGAAAGVRQVVTATGATAQVAGVGTMAMGRFGSVIQQLGTHAPLIARMQQSFLDAASGATRFGRSAGVAAAAAVGVRSAASGLSAALGGPWGIAIAAATVAVIGIANEVRKAGQQQDIMRESTTNLGIAQRQMARQFQEANGAVSKDVLASMSGQIEKVISDAERMADTMPGAFSVFTGGWQDIKGWFSLQAQAGTDAVRAQERAAKQGEAVRDSFREVGMSAEEMAARISGSDGDFNVFVGRLLSTKNGGEAAVAAVRQIRDAFLQAKQAALDTTPGFFTLSDAVKTLADRSSTASDRLSAMKQALDVLAGRQVSAQDALAKYNEQVRETLKVSQEWDKSLGSGKQLVGQNGQVDTLTENGKKLYDTLLGIRDATLGVAQSGGNLDQAFAQNEQQFQQLADAVGLSKDQVVEMAAQLGYLPTDIRIFAQLEGAGDVTQQLTAIAALLTRNREGVTIPAKALTDEAKAQLEKLGVTIEQVAGKPDEIRIIAKTDEALAKLQELAALRLPDKTQNVNVKYNDSGYSLPQGTRERLHENINDIPIAPRADGGIDNLPSSARIQSGRGRGLFQWAEGETGGEAFIPLAPSKRGRSAAILQQVAEMFGFNLIKMAEGGITGTIPRGVARAITAAKTVSGNKYQWGGTGPTNFDCSGFVGWIQQILQGFAGSTKRLYTTMSLLDGATAGLKPGLGPSGTYFQVGVNSQHMAASLNGQPLESGGSHGDSRIGSPAVGATDPQFTAHFYLPNELIDGINAPGVKTPRGKAKKVKEWTDADELKLESAKLDIQEAKDARDKVYQDKKSTETDKKRADLRVREAEQAVVDLQKEKDDRGKDALGDGNYVPEAPPLEKRLNDDQVEWEQAILDRDEAKDKRDEIYADPESTDRDLRRADLTLQAAENRIDEIRKKQYKKSPEGKAVDLLRKSGFGLLSIFFDAVSENLPFGFGELFKVRVNTPSDEDLDALTAPFTGVGPFNQQEIDRQLPITLDPNARDAIKPYINQAPINMRDWLKELPLRVYDQGGWLKPGEMAVNLSRRPEPILNSPAQMQQFLDGANLTAVPQPQPVPAGRGDTYNFNGMDPQSSARAMERVWRRRTLASQRGGGFGR